jgi:ligand-binding SRPBCC domain-containing protein
MRIREFHCELWLPKPPEEVFPFFSDAHNLQAITPEFLHFEVLTPAPITMAPGVKLDYRLTVRGLPLRWQSEITVWEPPHRFVDEQRKGPYRLWRHEHRFESRDGGTLATDHVQYAVWLDWLVHPLLVQRDVQRIFAFRQQKLREHFGVVR